MKQNFRNVDKIKQEAIWNEENQRWKIPELTFPKTKLPPAGQSVSAAFKFPAIFCRIMRQVRSHFQDSKIWTLKSACRGPYKFYFYCSAKYVTSQVFRTKQETNDMG